MAVLAVAEFHYNFSSWLGSPPLWLLLLLGCGNTVLSLVTWGLRVVSAGPWVPHRPAGCLQLACTPVTSPFTRCFLLSPFECAPVIWPDQRITPHLIALSVSPADFQILCPTFIFPLESESGVQPHIGNLHIRALEVSQTSCSQRGLYILSPLPFLTHTPTLAFVVFSISVQFTSLHPCTTIPDCILFYSSPRHISFAYFFHLCYHHCIQVTVLAYLDGQCVPTYFSASAFLFLSICCPNSSWLLPS